MRKRFALIGAAGFVAPRHLQAIHDTGNTLVAALDPCDSVGVLDRFFPHAAFFTHPETFEAYLEEQGSTKPEQAITHLAICSPNDLHEAHIRLALRHHATVICEKPLVLTPDALAKLEEMDQHHPERIYTMLQLRLHPALNALKMRLDRESSPRNHEVEFTTVSHRGPWYEKSWKGNEARSGGLVMNIGIHIFDCLQWLFGPVIENRVHHRSFSRAAGLLVLAKARVRWFLSIREEDLPQQSRNAGLRSFRNLSVDGEPIDFTEGFENLHTQSYRAILDGKGFGVSETKAALETVWQIQQATPCVDRSEAHPFLKQVQR